MNPSAPIAHAVEALGVADALTCGHPVDFAGPDHLLVAERVAMRDLAVEEVRDRRQADVRMRPHIGRARHRSGEFERPKVIEEDERADHATLRERQHAADLEAAEIARPRRDQQIDRRFRFLHVTAHRRPWLHTVTAVPYFFSADCSCILRN